MKIKDFIEELNNSVDRVKTIRKHIVRDYINFEEKIAASKHIANKLILENGDLVKNTPMVYENFILMLIHEYTDLEVTQEESLAAFNMIERNEVVEPLIAAIGKDVKTFNTILDMTINDTIDNHNNLVNHLSLKSDNIVFIIDKIQETLQKAIDKSSQKK